VLLKRWTEAPLATFLVAAGGTGGHVMPALPVARELAGRGHRCIFIGTRRGAEAKLVPAAGFEIEWIESAGLQRKSLLQMAGALAKLPVAVMQVRGLIAREKPVAMLSVGGYVAGPAVLAALSKGLPVVSVEPNAVPGLVTRKTANRVARACVSFEETLRWFPAGRAVVTGVPVRREFFEIGEKSNAKKGGEFTVLVTGGSQGSRTLNRAAREFWQSGHGAGVRFLLQCGVTEADDLRQVFAQTKMTGNVMAFIDDMPRAFNEADVIICRSGASTVAELCAAGKPSILVPFPFAADDHQTKNAEAMARAGAAQIMADAEWTGEAMVNKITQLRGAPEALHAMGAAARKLAHPEAARITADILIEVAEIH
jgi:UDP-N-acetylglucosamine--N-acetylmuramyl-(pentapeptide) pyrophosphoryl-undecaprenol N-acetylglucosamine transferase